MPAAAASNPNTQPAKTSYTDDVAHTAINDLTFGLGDKIAAGGFALAQPYTGDGSSAPSLAQRYADNLAAERTRDAREGYSATIPGHVLGAAGLVASSVTGLPEAAGAVTGINKLASIAAPATDAVGGAVENVLARLPGGTAILAPVAKGAATNAAIGAVAGGADADGGVSDHLQGAVQGAVVGAGLGAGGTAAMLAAKPVLRFGRAVYQGLGRGSQAPLTDATGAAISAPVTQGQADAAARTLATNTTNLPAAQAALDQHLATPAPIPGFQPTSAQVTADPGQMQLEQTQRAGNQQPFLDRASQQNTALVGAINNTAPAAASSDAVTPALQAQLDATSQAGQAAVATAQAGRDTAVSGLPATNDATPEQAGATLRQQVDQARAPAIQQADTQVQAAQQSAQGAAAALGGQVPVGQDGPATALQDYGSQFRQQLQDAQAAHVAPAAAIYQQLAADGTKALDVGPLKAASSQITSTMPASAIPMGADEARLHDLVAGYPQVQTLGELQALESSAKTIQAAQRGQGGDPQAVRRIGQLLDGITDTKAAAIEGAADPAPAAAPPAAGTATAAPGVGNTVYTPSGNQIGVQYEVAPASSLVTSHTDDMTPNPSYPAELQPRDRGRVASQAQVTSIANRLQPERLGASTTAADGAPIVGPDGMVESGNARTIAIRRAYAAGGQPAQVYRDFLTSQGHDTSGITDPVLIRRRTTPMTPAERVNFAQEANAPSVLSRSAGEVAQQDAGRITPDLLDLHTGGDVAEPANRDFVRAFAGRVVSPAERGSFATADGQLSSDGAQRMRNALTARAYGDRSLTDALAETADPRTRVLASGLEQAAPDMARLRAGIEAGYVDPNVDLAPHVSQALAALRVARDQRIPLADVVGQADAFDRMSPEAVGLLHAAYGPDLAGRASASDMADTLRHYARVAGAQSTEARLFGENLGSGQILAEAGARRGRSGGTETRAFAPDAPARSGDGASGLTERQPAPGQGGQTSPAGRGSSRLGRARYPADALPGAEAPALTPNFTEQDRADLGKANTIYRENKERFTRAPGVGAVLEEHPAGRGGFKLGDSQVPAQLFSGGAKAAERVQAAVKAGIDPEQLSQYVAFSLRRAAAREDGTLDPAKFAQWQAQHREALDALTRAAPAVGKRFAAAAGASRELDALQAQRTALDAAHPLKPGWSDSDIAMQAVRPGASGRERVASMLASAGNTAKAREAVSDVLSHLYQSKVIRDGEVDRGAHDRFVQAYGPALSAVPGLADKFRTVAGAQDAVDAASAAHVAAVKAYQTSAARFFLGGGEPADRIAQVLASPNRVADMKSLAALTANDPAARDGLKRAVVEHIQKRLLSQSLAGPNGERKIQAAAMQRFVRDNGAALGQLFNPHEVASFGHIADAIQTMGVSADRAKAAAGKAHGGHSLLGSLLGHLGEHALGAAGGGIGYMLGGIEGGAAGAYISKSLAGSLHSIVHGMKAAHIEKVDDLVTEALLNPGLMNVLLARITPKNEKSIGGMLATQLGRIAVMKAAQASVAGQQGTPGQKPAPVPSSTRLGADTGAGSLNQLAAL